MLYMGSSVAMNFVNKAALMEYNLPATLLLLQMVFAIAVVVPLRAAKAVSFPATNMAKAMALLPVTLLYTANVGFALLGLRTLNIPMYNALKRLTPVMILVAKSCMTRTLPPWQIAGSVLLIVGGCVVASLGDLTFDAAGYCYALLSCLLQCCYLLLVERTGAEKDASTWELLYYNAVLSLPFIAVTMVLTSEAGVAVPLFWAGASRLGVGAMSALLLFCSMAGILLNFALFWCTQLNSALSTTIAGVMKGVLATILGFFVFGGVAFHPLNVLGIAMNMSGGIWYTAVKYNQRRCRIQRTPSVTPLPAMDLEKVLSVAVPSASAGPKEATAATPLLWSYTSTSPVKHR